MSEQQIAMHSGPGGSPFPAGAAYRVRFTLSLGMFARGRVRRAIEMYCFENYLMCEVKDYGGLFTSVYGFYIWGDDKEAFDGLTGLLKALSGKEIEANYEA